MRVLDSTKLLEAQAVVLGALDPLHCYDRHDVLALLCERYQWPGPTSLRGPSRSPEPQEPTTAELWSSVGPAELRAYANRGSHSWNSVVRLLLGAADTIEAVTRRAEAGEEQAFAARADALADDAQAGRP